MKFEIGIYTKNPDKSSQKPICQKSYKLHGSILRYRRLKYVQVDSCLFKSWSLWLGMGHNVGGGVKGGLRWINREKKSFEIISKTKTTKEVEFFNIGMSAEKLDDLFNKIYPSWKIIGIGYQEVNLIRVMAI